MGSIDEGYFTDGRDRHTTFDAGEGRWKSVYPDATVAREVDIEATTRILQTVIQDVLKDSEDSGEIAHRSAQVIRLRFFGTSENGWQPMTLEEVAQVFNEITGTQYTRERIRQIEARTLAIFRKPDIANRIRPFIE